MVQKTNAKLRYILEEETNLPYFFDIVIYEKVENEELKKVIDGAGKMYIALNRGFDG